MLCFFFSNSEWTKENEFCTNRVLFGNDTWVEEQHPHLQHNTAKSNHYTCRSITPKNVLASLAQISWCLAASYVVNLGVKFWKLHWRTSQQSPKCCRAVPTLQSLESDQLDTAICASVKMSDYYTADSSSWICAWLTTVSSSPHSLNQNKHLGSIIPSWRPLIVRSQSTFSRTGLNAKLQTNTPFKNSSSQKHLFDFLL